MLLRLVCLAFCLQLGSTVPGVSQAAVVPPADDGPVSFGLVDGVAMMRAGNWTGALDAAARAGPVARDVIDWHRLRDGLGNFDTAVDFLIRRPDWPGLSLLRSRTEKFLPIGMKSDRMAGRVISFFGRAEPTTGHGTLALVNSHRHLGSDGDAMAQAALAWVDRSMTSEAERALYSYYPDVLGPLEAQRLDAMFWSREDPALQRAIERHDGPESDLAQIRLDARRGRAVDSALARLPAELRDDGGVAYERFRAHLGRDDHDRALALLKSRSVSAEKLGLPSAWADARRDLARRYMREGEVEDAYAIASSHWLTEGSDFADLEWLSGYLALTYLDQPETAERHFQRFRAAVETPISLGRAGYWLGRAFEAQGLQEEADQAYAFGAIYQTSFYGLLAAEKLGLELDPSLSGQESFPTIGEAPFRESDVLEAALLLQAAGERDAAERFFVHLVDSLEREEIGTLGDLVLDLGEPHLALLIAKRAAQKGLTLPRAYYPVVDLGVADMPVTQELALSIARRESEFDPGVSSGVGARGLMQLMPGTAQDVARELRLAYSSQRLFSDPSYNATLGTAYLAGLIGRFGDNPILVSAGYNAGPGRPLRWMRERGDPRSSEVDVIDWIEHIPFDETRNYVMRVAESLPVYRARLGVGGGPVDLTAEIKGR